MNTLQIQNLYNTILKEKEFYKNYGSAFENYEQVCNKFDEIVLLLQKNLSYSKGLLATNSNLIYRKLQNQTLESRLNFINLCKLHVDDVENLKKTITKYIGNNIPVLELFPGCGQFLPYAVSSEPLYIADRYLEICDYAADILQNEFYKNRRLRKYKLKDYDTLLLPQVSFGLVYCFNEFYYANNEYIIKWANAIFDLLYCGGVFIFNFLPDDHLWSQEVALKLDYTVIDYKDLVDKLKNIGFLIEECKLQPFRSSYIICKKPGEIQPRYKIGGGIAEIIDL